MKNQVYHSHPRRALLLGSLNDASAPVLAKLSKIIPHSAVVVTLLDQTSLEREQTLERVSRAMAPLGINVREISQHSVSTLDRQITPVSVIIPHADPREMAGVIASLRYTLPAYSERVPLIIEGDSCGLIGRGTQATDYLAHPNPEAPETLIESLAGIRMISSDVALRHTTDEETKIENYLASNQAGETLYIINNSSAIYSSTDAQGKNTIETIGDVRTYHKPLNQSLGTQSSAPSILLPVPHLLEAEATRGCLWQRH